MKRHPDAPLFAKHRRYRIETINGLQYRVAFKTIWGYWWGCSNVYPSIEAALSEAFKIKFGVLDWEPVNYE